MLTMQEQREMNEMFAKNGYVPVRPVVSAEPFNPHALAMALQLADLLEGGPGQPHQHWVYANVNAESDWLRAEVQKELEAQP